MTDDQNKEKTNNNDGIRAQHFHHPDPAKDAFIGLIEQYCSYYQISVTRNLIDEVLTLAMNHDADPETQLQIFDKEVHIYKIKQQIISLEARVRLFRRMQTLGFELSQCSQASVAAIVTMAIGILFLFDESKPARIIELISGAILTIIPVLTGLTMLAPSWFVENKKQSINDLLGEAKSIDKNINERSFFGSRREKYFKTSNVKERLKPTTPLLQKNKPTDNGDDGSAINYQSVDTNPASNPIT